MPSQQTPPLRTRGRTTEAEARPSAPGREGQARVVPSLLSRNVAGICLASLLSDTGHEMATATLPLFLAAIGASPSALGIVEGLSDGAATLAKLAGGRVADRRGLRHRLAAVGYLLTGLATGSFALAGSWIQLLVARIVGWLGRGWRGPARANLLVASVALERVGAAFGLERAADTVGAILGPLIATLLLHRIGLRGIFLLSLFPGVLAAAAFFFIVREPGGEALHRQYAFPGWHAALTPAFRTFLVAVGVFGIGDFAHSMLVLRAAQLLGSSARAMSLAILLYIFHNTAHALLSYPIGAIGDRVERRRLLAAAYVLAAIAAAGFATSPRHVTTLTLLFVLEGAVMAAQEALASAIATDLVPSEARGTGFGILQATSGIGDLVSSIVVGFLWSSVSPMAAFTYTALASLIAAPIMLLSCSERRPG
jgi:MFS family permease